MNSFNSFISFLVERKSQILDLLLQHIQLTLLSITASVLIAIPLTILIVRYRKLSGPVIGFTNIVQSIPSLALLGFLIPVVGIGSKPAIIMVVMYSLLPIVKNTFAGLTNINPSLIEAADGMGLTKTQVLLKVRFPLAMPIIMSGIRISAVTAIGLMTIAAFIGAGGLGYLVFSGVQSVNNNMILAGAIPACFLAILLDFLLGKVEDIVVPRGIRAASNKKPNKFFNSKKFKLVALVLAFLLILTSVVATFSKAKNTIVVASKNYNEQIILGNMVASLIEDKTKYKVERKMNLGGTAVIFNAMKSKDVDVYVEYTGTGLVNIMKQPAISDSDKAYTAVKDYFDKNYALTWLKPMGFNNTYTLSVRKDTAEKYNLKTFSDLAKVSNNLTIGSTLEFNERQDGYPGIKKLYNMNFKNVKPVNGGLRYTALINKDSDVIDAFSTDGLLKAFDLVVLKDDKNFFPPYYAAPLVRNDTLKKHPEIQTVLNKLAGQISDEEMREMNYKVDKLNADPAKVAEDFLKAKGLIQ